MYKGTYFLQSGPRVLSELFQHCLAAVKFCQLFPYDRLDCVRMPKLRIEKETAEQKIVSPTML